MSKVSFQGQTVHELRDGNSQVLMAPQFGARLLKWTVGKREIIFWPENADWSSRDSIAHTRGGNPILFPFLGRHYVNGELGKWRDESGGVRDLPMHGFARVLPFQEIESDARHLRMRLETSEQTRTMYPFEFRFDVVYRLTGSTLEAIFETSNLGSTPLPYYAGHHFYFAIAHAARADWQIELPCKTWGRQNADGSPRLFPAQNNATTLADSDLIDRFHLDFYQPGVTLQNATKNEKIILDWPQEYSRLWHDVTTWTGAPDADYYCVEPWLGLPDAIHHGHGLRHVAPNATEASRCRIRAETL
jgi:galactose mutarotase-like enzyme